MQQKWPNKREFKVVYAELSAPNSFLTIDMVGRVFGPPFYELIIQALMDSNDAARAIAGAVQRLKDGEVVEAEVN